MARLNRRAFPELAAFAAAGAASPRSRESPRAMDGRLRLAGDEPSTLDPALVRDTSASAYTVEVFAGLTRIGPDLAAEGALAADWTLDPTGAEYRFRLRSDLRFHDGRRLTAGDVAWSWTRALAPQTGSLSAQVYLGEIMGAEEVQSGAASELAGVRALDDHTLLVRLARPSRFFPAQLASGPALVVDRADVARGPEWFRRPNGSGPFRLAVWERDRLISLQRAETYQPGGGGPARVDYLQLDPGEGLLRYEQDELDLVGVGGATVERFSDPREPRSAHLRRTPSLAVSYLGFNTAIPPFDNQVVRRAFAMAIDRRRINQVTLRGLQVEARGVIPPGLPSYRPTYGGLPFSPAAARWELASSFYGSAENLPEIRLTAAGRGLLEGPLARALVRPWRSALGIPISIELLDFPDFIRALDDPSHEQQMFLLAWSADFPDAFSFVDVLFGSQRPDNYSRLDDPEVDRRLELARAAPDTATRLRHYAAVESRVVERAVVAPLFFGVSHELVQPWVRGYAGRPIVREWLTEIEINDP